MACLVSFFFVTASNSFSVMLKLWHMPRILSSVNSRTVSSGSAQICFLIADSAFCTESGLSLIIVAAIFLVVVGYTSEQIAPVMGLLGAIAGYILGSKRSSE